MNTSNNSRTTAEMLTDFITGKPVPNVGPEENRQKVEQYLIQNCGYRKSDVEVDVPFELEIGGAPYRTKIDLIVRVKDIRAMAIKCVTASLSSWEREIVSAARVLHTYQMPYAIVSDGTSAIVLDTISGKQIGQGMDAIPRPQFLNQWVQTFEPRPFPKERLEKAKLVFKSYDSMNVNRILS